MLDSTTSLSERKMWLPKGNDWYDMDTNKIERLNRYVSTSRRNSLLFGSHDGAERGAIYYTLACSCRLCGVNFFDYLSDVIDRMAALPPKQPNEAY